MPSFHFSRRRFLQGLAATSAASALAPLTGRASETEVRSLQLHPLFSDHAVFQAGKPLHVIGRATPGATVECGLRDAQRGPISTARTTADTTGRWSATLAPLPAEAADELVVTSGAETLVVRDVVIGEVWLCSGQSNMEYPIDCPYAPREKEVDGNVALARREAAEVAPAIRYFTVEKHTSERPLDEVKGRWVVATPDAVPQCSAVAWNFALTLQRALHRPIGLVVSSWGGSTVEAWLPADVLAATAVGPALLRRHDELMAAYPAAKQRYDEAMGKWRREDRARGLPSPSAPYGPGSSHLPILIYNGLIHGLLRYSYRGVLWYQGESNAERPEEYGELILSLVRAWRAGFHDELPFYYVELAGNFVPQQEPSEGELSLYRANRPDRLRNRAWIREAQAAVLSLPATGVATAIDLGLAENVHPPFKKPVGERLAGLALNDLYGHPQLARSPEFIGLVAEGKRLRLQFNHADGLRPRRGAPHTGFAICGADRHWQWAEWEISGNDVVAWHPAIATPTAVRYAWASNPRATVENRAGLPLRPFRTDRFTP